MTNMTKLSKSMKNALDELRSREPGWHIASSLKANYRTLYALKVRGLVEYENALCDKWKLSEKGMNDLKESQFLKSTGMVGIHIDQK